MRLNDFPPNEAGDIFANPRPKDITTMTLDTGDVFLTLDGDTDIVVHRDFNHPPAKVWRALTEPALIQRWLGDMKRCEMDPHPGGTFHYEWDDFYFDGRILTVNAPHQMTHVENFSLDSTYNAEITTSLIARGSGTRMTVVMRYANSEARASALANGFTDGLDKVYDRLEAIQFGM